MSPGGVLRGLHAFGTETAQFVLDWRHGDRPEPAPNARSRFENCNGFSGITRGEAVGGEGAGHSRPNDDDVDGLAFDRSLRSASNEQPGADTYSARCGRGEPEVDGLHVASGIPAPMAAENEPRADADRSSHGCGDERATINLGHLRSLRRCGFVSQGARVLRLVAVPQPAHVGSATDNHQLPARNHA